MQETGWHEGDLYRWRILGKYSIKFITDMLQFAAEGEIPFKLKAEQRNDDGYIALCTAFCSKEEERRFKDTFYQIGEQESVKRVMKLTPGNNRHICRNDSGLITEIKIRKRVHCSVISHVKDIF